MLLLHPHLIHRFRQLFLNPTQRPLSQETVGILTVAVLTVTIEVGIGARHLIDIINPTLDHIILVAILALARDLFLLFEIRVVILMMAKEMYRLVLLTDIIAVDPAHLCLALFNVTFVKVGVINPLMVAPRNQNRSDSHHMWLW